MASTWLSAAATASSVPAPSSMGAVTDASLNAPRPGGAGVGRDTRAGVAAFDDGGGGSEGGAEAIASQYWQQQRVPAPLDFGRAADAPRAAVLVALDALLRDLGAFSLQPLDC